ncbi:hypothetical protein FHU29_004603 [Hoyosella altamirensis]|uniref:Uncharacterized protein n=1 Tax=Hoyosella altamirensis TaxID=616997 RepID=A0A839RV55_9ACTN|nr:hypothetical protein [Hoyosella altamirensis]
MWPGWLSGLRAVARAVTGWVRERFWWGGRPRRNRVAGHGRAGCAGGFCSTALAAPAGIGKHANRGQYWRPLIH